MNELQHLPPLFQHTRRPEWGLAILAWEGPDKRRYRFQDGRERTLREGFFHLMEPVEKPLDVTIQVARDLAAHVGSNGRPVAEARTPAEAESAPIRLEDQIELFTRLYTEGFRSPTYVDEVRAGTGKRHRDPAVRRAAEQLSRDRLGVLLAAGRFGEVHAAALAVLEGTTLTRPVDQKALETLPEAEHEDFARALYALLHGEEAFFDRFTRLVAVLDRAPEGAPTWLLVTALPALVHPDQHVCVKPAVFREQARSMAPRLGFQKEPNAALYERFRHMALTVRDELQAASLKPRDLLDVHEFIWLTLRPAARKSMKSPTRVAEAA